MATTSLFPQYVEKYFPNYVLSVAEQLNGRSLTSQIPFIFKNALTPRFSADGRWAAISAKYTQVTADVVALGSPVPLKSRDRLRTLVGDIPKLGVKRSLNEVELKNIDTMIAQNRPEADVVNRIFSDVPFVINAVDEKIEDLFLALLSRGEGMAIDNNNIAIRFGLSYPTDNQHGVSKAWSDPTSTPIDDITARVIDLSEATGGVRFCYADDTVLKAMYTNEQVRGLFGFQQNYVGGGANVPNLSFIQLRDLFMNMWGITLIRVQRTTYTETNGTRNTHKAWKDGTMVFTRDQQVGDLVYTSCVEETRPVPGVAYQVANQYCLVSQYSEQEPFIEFTKSQAMVVPIVNNVDTIYTLDTKTVQA